LGEATLKLRLLLVLLLLTLPASAGDPDLLAALGAFKSADEAYVAALTTASGPERVRLLERRLVLADLRKNPGLVRDLLGQLEKLNPDANTRLSMELARGNLAYRLGRFPEARQAFAKVDKLAQGGSPQQIFSRYAAASFDFWNRWLTQGIPSGQAYLDAFQNASAPLLKISWPQDAKALLPLLLNLMQANAWTREWVRRGALTTIDLYWSGRPNDAGAWGMAVFGLTEGIRAFGTATVDTPAGKVAGCNSTMAWRYSYDDALLDYVDLFGRGVDSVSEANITQRLQLARRDAADRKALLDWTTANLLGGQAPVYTEDLRQQAQLARAEGLNLMLHGQVDQGLAKAAEAARLYRDLGLYLDELETHSGTALVLAAGAPQHEALLREAKAAREGAERLQDNYRAYFALMCEGTGYFYKGDQDSAAESSLRAAVALLGEILAESGATQDAKQQIVTKAKPLFDMLIQVLLRQKKEAEALEVVNLQQSATLLANLDRQKVKAPPRSAATYARVERLRGAQQELKTEIQHAEAVGDRQNADRLRQKLADSKGEYYRALNQLRAEDPTFAGAISIQPTSFGKIKDVLPEGVVLVQYGMGEKKLYVFVARRSGLQLHEVQVTADALRQDVAAVRQAMVGYSRNPGPLTGETRATLGRLHDTLIGPIEGELSSAKMLVVAPSQDLYYLPFAALAKSGGPYLIERVPLAIVTGLELMEFMKTSRVQAMESLLALGNPDGSLPAAGQEVDGVAALFPAKKVYMGPQATRDKLNKLGGASVLHLATHGVLDKNVNNGYLLLANGQLSTGEIYGLDLGGLGLVTLSACQTGVASFNKSANFIGKDGAEVASLAQAFSVAGGHSILASLWSVSDEATAKLMINFYENLLKKKQGRAQALQQAQLVLLKNPQTAHPFLWAAFELIGDWR